MSSAGWKKLRDYSIVGMTQRSTMNQIINVFKLAHQPSLKRMTLHLGYFNSILMKKVFYDIELYEEQNV